MPIRSEPVWDRIASDDYVCEIGRVVYEANRLETVAASLLFDYEYMDVPVAPPRVDT
jgi:hypothetical protein